MPRFAKPEAISDDQIDSELDQEELALEQALSEEPDPKPKLSLRPASQIEQATLLPPMMTLRATPSVDQSSLTAPKAEAIQAPLPPPQAPKTQFVTAHAMTPEQKEKLERLNAQVALHEKSYGSGVVRVASDNTVVDDAVFIPTGILPFDASIGGGFARGRVYELYGPEGSGKTTVALEAIASGQRLGGIGGYIDAEHALDRLRSAQIGVDLNMMPVWQPDWGEQALDIAYDVVNGGTVDVLVIDSVAALVPKVELDGEMGDQQMGLHARMIGKGIRKLKAATRRTGCTVIFINQLRMKIGLVFGNPEVTPGGKALGFFADVRIEIRRKELLKSGELIIGQRVETKCIKNKLCPPHQSASFEIYYSARGIDKVGAVLDAALQLNVITKNGNWHAIPIDSKNFPAKYSGMNIGNGREAAIAGLESDAELFDHLRTVMTEALLSSRRLSIERLADDHRAGITHAQPVLADEEAEADARKGKGKRGKTKGGKKK